jgi:hypothetical protein
MIGEGGGGKRRVLCDNLYEKLCAVLVNVKGTKENEPKR